MESAEIVLEDMVLSRCKCEGGGFVGADIIKAGTPMMTQPPTPNVL